MNIIEKTQIEISEWYESSSVSHFLSWWKYHLKSFVPVKYHKSLFADSSSIVLVSKKGQVEIWSKDSSAEPLRKTNTENDGEENWWHQVQNLVSHSENKNVNIDYLLPQSEVLVRKIALPVAAKDNLEEVIGFELDKYVPFNKDQVQLSYKIDTNNSNDETILVDIAVMPKSQIKEIVEDIGNKAVQLSSIDVNTSSADKPSKLGVNLLSREKQKPKDYSTLKINAILLALLFGLMYFVMYTATANKQDKIERLSSINAELQKQARASKLLKKELNNTIVSSQFLSKKNNSYKSPVAFLLELTSILPEDTYITRMRVTDEKIEVSGESQNANGLIPKLDKSKRWYSPNFPRAVVPNSRTNKERFTVEASLIEPEQEGENATNP